jgi:Tfp pilus assembly protein PilF
MPDYANAHYNLALVMAQQEKYDDAIEHFDKALKIKPDWPEVHYNLGCIYYRQGRLKLTIKEFTDALQLRPGYTKAGIDLAHTLLELGQIQSAIDCYYKMLQIEPNQPELLKQLAWILATCQRPTFRNGKEAIRFAERACKLTDYKDPGMLDTLAAAYAAAGRFSDATATAENALVQALCSKEDQLTEQIRSHLFLYKKGQPYIEPLPKSSAD